MKIVEIKQVNDTLVEMIALFRVELRSYIGIESKPNIEAGREEKEEYFSAKFPVYLHLILFVLLYLHKFFSQDELPIANQFIK